RVVRSREETFDLAHHATYGSDWLPCALLLLRRTPVVWGSVGGIAPVPWRLARYISVLGIPTEVLRELVTRIVRRLTLRLVRHADCTVVARNRETAEYFGKRGANVI